MNAPTLPYVPGAVRALLLADPSFGDLVADRVVTRAPADVTSPYALVQVPDGLPINASAGVWSPLVQVDGWCSAAASDDPELIAWTIAAGAARVLSRARNVAWQTMHYSARIIDGPVRRKDTSRGEGNPLWGCGIRAELILHAR